MPDSDSNKQGLVAATAAFVIWGFFPVYFHALHQVPALQVISHRIAWACLFVLGWMFFRGELGQVRAALVSRGVVLRHVRRVGERCGGEDGEDDPRAFAKCVDVFRSSHHQRHQ